MVGKIKKLIEDLNNNIVCHRNRDEEWHYGYKCALRTVIKELKKLVALTFEDLPVGMFFKVKCSVNNFGLCLKVDANKAYYFQQQQLRTIRCSTEVVVVDIELSKE